MRVLETTVQHPSDLIRWLEASGHRSALPAPITEALAVALSDAPRDLRLDPRRGAVVLWRGVPAGLARAVAGAVPQDQRDPPAQAPYTVAGRVTDPAGRFNPRTFAVTAGSGTGHGVAVFRSPLGTRFGAGGGIAGNLRFAADEAPASWAVVEVEVSPLLGGTLGFAAQADVHGDFLLALDRLPPLARDAPEPTHPAVLRVRASRAASGAGAVDPDTLPARSLGHPEHLTVPEGDTLFVAEIPLRLAPGEVNRATTKNRRHLALHER